MKALIQFLVFFFLPCILMAQFNSDLLYNKLEFLENTTSKAELRYDGTDLFLENSETDGSLYFTGTEAFFYTSGLARLHIDELGRVGLGPINPAMRLTVAGNIALTAGNSLIKFMNGPTTNAIIEFDDEDLTIENLTFGGEICGWKQTAFLASGYKGLPNWESLKTVTYL